MYTIWLLNRQRDESNKCSGTRGANQRRGLKGNEMNILINTIVTRQWRLGADGHRCLSKLAKMKGMDNRHEN